MTNTSKAVRFLYGTCFGRCLLKIIMKLHLDRIVTTFLWSPCSKPLIGWYIRHNGISVTKAEMKAFRSFRVCLHAKEAVLLSILFQSI